MLNPIRGAQRVVSHLVETTDTEEEPDWDDQGALTRAAAWAKYRKSLVIAAVFALVAVVFWLYPVLPSAHRNYWTLALAVWALSSAFFYSRGRTAGFTALREYDLNIVYTGRSVVPRLGRVTGDIDDRMVGMKVLKELKRGGLSAAYEQFRDRFNRREIQQHKEKYHRVDDDGSGDVVRGVPKGLTTRTDTCEFGIDVFNTISVTHAGEERTEMDSKEVDTMLTLPPTVDERVTTDVRQAMVGQEDARKLADQRYRQLENYVEQLEEYVDPGGKTIFEETKKLFQEINRETRRPARNGNDEEDSIAPDFDAERYGREQRNKSNGGEY